MNPSKRTRASHKEGKPNPRRGTVVGLHPVHFDWLVPNCLHQGRTSYIKREDALTYGRELALHFGAGFSFDGFKPPRALRFAVCTVNADAESEFERIGKEAGIAAYRIPIIRPAFRGTRLVFPSEFTRFVRASNPDFLLAEGETYGASELRSHLADMTALPIIAPGVSACGKSIEISTCGNK